MRNLFGSESDSSENSDGDDNEDLKVCIDFIHLVVLDNSGYGYGL